MVTSENLSTTGNDSHSPSYTFIPAQADEYGLPIPIYWSDEAGKETAGYLIAWRVEDDGSGIPVPITTHGVPNSRWNFLPGEKK